LIARAPPRLAGEVVVCYKLIPALAFICDAATQSIELHAAKVRWGRGFQHRRKRAAETAVLFSVKVRDRIVSQRLCWFSSAATFLAFLGQLHGRRSWYYKLDEIVYQGDANGMIVPLLTLDYLRRFSRDTFLFTTELEFSREDGQIPIIEADLCCVVDGVLTIGEAKRDSVVASSQAASTAAMEKYRDLARQLLARQVVFATLSDSWSTETVRYAKRVFAKEHLQLKFLTGKELLQTAFLEGLDAIWSAPPITSG
jgi:hypothetical protein